MYKKEKLTAEIVAKGIIAFLNFILDLVIIFIVLVLLAFAGYSIWDTNRIYVASDPALYETYKPAEDAASFDELVAINEDVLGWISIYGTGVDYPLLQGKSNDVYMNTSASGEFSLGGSIFLDYRNAKDFSDFNTIIYGHHMKDSKMFGDIEKYTDEDFFKAHTYGDLYYDGAHHGLEFFAYVDADAYDFTLYNEAVSDSDTYLSYVQSVSKYWATENAPTADGHIVMLSTCQEDKTNGRYVLFGKITDNVFENTYEEVPTVITRTLRGEGGHLGVPAWLLVIVIILVALTIVLTLRMIYVRRERRKRRERCRSEGRS